MNGRRAALVLVLAAGTAFGAPVDPVGLGAASGDPAAQMRLAATYAASGTPSGRRQAFAWRLRAARQGYAEAYLPVAQGFHDGLAGPEDVPRALYWFERAAASGNASAQNEVAYHLALDGLDLARANQLADQALAAQPENPHFLDTKATILEREGRWHEAERLLRKAHRLAPQDAELDRQLWRAEHRQSR